MSSLSLRVQPGMNQRSRQTQWEARGSSSLKQLDFWEENDSWMSSVWGFFFFFLPSFPPRACWQEVLLRLLLGSIQQNGAEKEKSWWFFWLFFDQLDSPAFHINLSLCVLQVASTTRIIEDVGLITKKNCKGKSFGGKSSLGSCWN